MRIYSSIPYFLFISIFLIACRDPETPTPPTPPTVQSAPNILLIIADDMGIDASPCYSTGAIKPNMPNLESLCSNGLTFDNLWAAPVCSPTRATIITGKYGFRTNVITAGDLLSTSETSLQSFINDNSSTNYQQAVIGKWHLSGNGRSSHPLDFGLDHFAGITGGAVGDYFSWPLDSNRVESTTSAYATTKITDLAIDWIQNQDQPWFTWVAYNAAHTPLHLPPANLHSQSGLTGEATDIDNNPLPYYLAMLEAMDTEMGRLFDAIPQEEMDNTIIMFIGDNGTIMQAVQQPYTRRQRKGTLYQGGVNVPMIISGVGVERKGERESALINTSDFFATIADLSQTGTTEINDSQSFSALLSDGNAEKRDYAYVDFISDNAEDEWAIRDETFKLIQRADGSQEFFNLINDPYEGNDLMQGNLTTEEAEAKSVLEQKVIEIQQ